MKISPEQKKKLKDFLGIEISDVNTKQSFKQVSEAISKLETKVSSTATSDALDKSIAKINNKVSAIKNTDLGPVVEALNKFVETLSKTHKPQDLSGFFKDLGVQLGEFGSSSKNTEALIRNLKWNSTMGIKNRDGSPISPAISPFAIRDYDDIQLSGYDANGNPGTVRYYQGGGLIATITLTYDINSNLTEAKRTA